MKFTQKKCPLCKKGKLVLMTGCKLWISCVLFGFLVRPVRIVYLIRGQFNKQYKCNLCRKTFWKGTIDHM